MKSGRGGKRENSGRPALFDEQTKVMRVPISKVEEIKAFLLSNENPNQIDIETAELKEKLERIDDIVWKYTAQQNDSPRWAQAKKLLNELKEILK